MENNKIYICVKFIYVGNNGSADQEQRTSEYSFELNILRDATLKQLLYGIKFGLQRRISSEDPTHREIYQKCHSLFRKYIDLPKSDTEDYDGNWNFDSIFLANFDINTDVNAKYLRQQNEYPENEKKKIIIDNSIRKIVAEDLGRPLCDIGFISSTKIGFLCMDHGNKVQSSNVRMDRIADAFRPDSFPKPEVTFPKYNISTRIHYRFDETPVDIIPPSDPPQKNKQNLFFTLLPTVLSISAMMLLRSYMSGSMNSGYASSNSSMMIMTAGMGLVTVLTTILSFWQQNRNYEKSVAEWKTQYENYLNRLMTEIRVRQYNDTDQMDKLYPNTEEYFSDPHEIKKIVGMQVYSRSYPDEDFLSVRLGTSNQVESKFPINGTARQTVFSPAYFLLKDRNGNITENSDDMSVSLHLNKNDETISSNNYLASLPAVVSQRFRYLKNAPLMYSLKNCGTLGIVCQSDTMLDPKQPGYTNAQYFLDRLIFDLCYYHSPENLQFVIFHKKTHQWRVMEECTQMQKYMPHFHELLYGISQFVFDEHSANLVLNHLLKIASEREAQQDQAQLPHIVVIVYEEYNIKEHAFARYLPTAPMDGKPYENKNGMSFIFVKEYREHLPSYCNHIINITDEKTVLMDCTDENHTVEFSPDAFARRKKIMGSSTMMNAQSKEMESIYQMLSALYYTQISQNRKVPSSVGMFKLHGVTSDNLEQKIVENWFGDSQTGKRNYNVTSSLGVKIGKTELGSTVLDLHEKADGPHMLVAGTTGSGKSETILSFLLGLCMQYRPDEVNLMLVDMKGGGFIKRIGMLPHVVGKVTDVDGDETNTGAAYMLRRFLDALKSEIKMRKLWFNKMHVDNIDAYIKACNNIDLHIKQEKINEPEATELREFAKIKKLSHLFLVVDEFTELKRFASENNDMDFIGEITTIARVGRSLGFHIILVSQNIEGAITDDIRINSKSRLCLKVATRQASKEMIGNEMAADPSMPGNGRAYLLVGTGSKFEYFQSAYSGMNTQEDIEMPTEIIQVEMTGQYTQFYDSDKDNEIIKKRKDDLKSSGELETQLKAIVRTIVALDKKHRNVSYQEPHIVFQPPLPRHVILRDGVMVDLDAKKEENDTVSDNEASQVDSETSKGLVG